MWRSGIQTMMAKQIRSYDSATMITVSYIQLMRIHNGYLYFGSELVIYRNKLTIREN